MLNLFEEKNIFTHFISENWDGAGIPNPSSCIGNMMAADVVVTQRRLYIY